MKLTDLAILFIIIIFPFYLVLHIRGDSITATTYKKAELNRIIDTALEDAATAIASIDGDRNIKIHREEGINTLIDTMAMNLNGNRDPYFINRLFTYLPAIAVVDYDGYYILSTEVYKDKEDQQYTNPLWKPKKKYEYKVGNSYIFFTLTDEFILVRDDQSYKHYRQQDLKKNVTELRTINNAFGGRLSDEKFFDQLRRNTIIQSLEQDLAYYINQHNDYAQTYGLAYHFQLPTIDEEDWMRTIDDVSILAFFQGIPLNNNGEYFNSYAIGGARIIKSRPYYMYDSRVGDKTYHRWDCSLLEALKSPSSNPYEKSAESREACAIDGYMPCQICQP